VSGTGGSTEDMIPACPSRRDVVSDGRAGMIGGCEERGFFLRDEGQHSVSSRCHPSCHQSAFWVGRIGGVRPLGCQDSEGGILPDWCGGVCPELGAPWSRRVVGRSGRNSMPARDAGEDIGEGSLFCDDTSSQEKMENVAPSLAKGREVNWLTGQMSQFGIRVNTSKIMKDSPPD